MPRGDTTSAPEVSQFRRKVKFDLGDVILLGGPFASLRPRRFGPALFFYEKGTPHVWRHCVSGIALSPAALGALPEKGMGRVRQAAVPSPCHFRLDCDFLLS
jgi:hypothetical protein